MKTKPRLEPVARQLRRLMAEPGLIPTINLYDPLTARIAQQAGFKVVGLGGNALGTQKCVPEPLLTMTETIDAARQIVQAIDIPLIVDCGAGYGDGIHVMRTVKEAEAAGIAGVFVEDQFYPKRAHYHRGIEEIISAEEMVDKISAAVDARRDPDFVILGRTDAVRTDNVAAAIRRGNLYAEAGCDMILAWPRNVDEARIIPKEISAPCVLVNSPGNRHGRQVYSWAEAEDMGFKLLLDAPAVFLWAAKSMRNMLQKYVEERRPPAELVNDIETRNWVEDLVGLPKLYAVEEQAARERREVK